MLTKLCNIFNKKLIIISQKEKKKDKVNLIINKRSLSTENLSSNLYKKFADEIFDDDYVAYYLDTIDGVHYIAVDNRRLLTMVKQMLSDGEKEKNDILEYFVLNEKYLYYLFQQLCSASMESLAVESEYIFDLYQSSIKPSNLELRRMMQYYSLLNIAFFIKRGNTVKLYTAVDQTGHITKPLKTLTYKNGILIGAEQPDLSIDIKVYTEDPEDNKKE